MNPCQLFATTGDPASYSNVVSQELAAQAITAIADIFEVSVNELREISPSPPGIASLGLDSLTSLEIVHKLTILGVNLPIRVSGNNGFFVQEVLEYFLESFIVEHGNAFDPE